MLIVSYALTGLVDTICDGNPGVIVSFVADMYYDKEAKYLELPWEVSKEAEIETSTTNSDDESTNKDGEKESESLIVGSQDVPDKEVIEAFKARDGDQALVDRPDSIPKLSLEELEGQEDEGVVGDQSGTYLPDPIYDCSWF